MLIYSTLPTNFYGFGQFQMEGVETIFQNRYENETGHEEIVRIKLWRNSFRRVCPIDVQ